jgi:pilus assembly protein CpaB
MSAVLCFPRESKQSKRMKPARIVVLTIALGAGGVAAYLASGSDSDNRSAPAKAAAELQTVDVLVAKSDIGLGQTVKPEDLQWQTWPVASASNSFIRRSDHPDAPKAYAGSTVRVPFMAGEPIREQKLVRANSGFMAAILPPGMRAISTDISPETAAGGFILPDDRVDVILSKRDKPADRGGGQEVVNSQIILSNVRVLAIDQAPKEKDGQNTLLGKTVTLELAPEQAETLARARQSGTLSLALRSIADANTVENRPDAQAPSLGASINIVRYGVPTTQTTQK